MSQWEKLKKNRSKNFLAFVSTRARSGSRPDTYDRPTPLSPRHLRNQYRQKAFCDFDFNKNGGYRKSWDRQMWEICDTMGELGHGHGAWFIAQLSHIWPLCERVGPCNDNLFYP